MRHMSMSVQEDYSAMPSTLTLSSSDGKVSRDAMVRVQNNKEDVKAGLPKGRNNKATLDTSNKINMTKDKTTCLYVAQKESDCGKLKHGEFNLQN